MYSNNKWQLRLRPVILIAITFTLALLASVFVYASQVRQVEIDDRGKKIIVKTMGRTVGDVLRENEVNIDKTVVNPDIDCLLGTVNLIEIREAAAQAAKAEKMTELAQAGYLAGMVRKTENKGLEQEIQNKTVRTEKVVVVKERVPFSVERRASGKLNRGETKVIREGKSGTAEKSYQVVYRDGKEVSRKLINKKVIIKPVTEIVEYGTISTLVLPAHRL